MERIRRMMMRLFLTSMLRSDDRSIVTDSFKRPMKAAQHSLTT